MKSIIRATALAFIAAAFAGCAAGGSGFLGTNFNPKGDIAFTDIATGVQINSTVGSPYVSSKPAFTFNITETHFDGPYTVVITSWNNGFSKPCFVPHQISTSANVNEWTLSADNANPPTATAGSPNPCVTGGGDEETAQVSDGKGNTRNLYFTY